MQIYKFNEIEQEYNLYKDKIEGVNYWEYIRFDIWHYQFCQRKLGLERAHSTKKSVLERFRLIVELAYNCCKGCRLPKEKVDICFIAHERRQKKDNFYQCIYTDKLAEAYSNSVILEKPYQYGHLRPVCVQNLCYTDSILVKSSIKYMVHKFLNTKKYKSLLEEVKKKLEEPIKKMQKAYDLNFPNKEIYRYAVKKIIMYQYQYKEYEKLILKLQPKLIIEVCHYNMQCMIINEIAEKMDIYTVELQHGTMHEAHCAYQYADVETITQLPKSIFLFSDYWKSCINMPLKTDKLIPVGFPYFETERQKYLKKNNNFKGKDTILFISQGIIGIYLSKLAVNLDKLLDNTRYKIIYKLHPGEFDIWKEKYPWLLDSQIEIADDLEHNLYEYLNKSDIQVGVNSTGLYEGLGFGLRTFIYNVGTVDTMNKLIELHYAYKVNNAEELAKKINDTTLYTTQKDLFWKQNALQNMRVEIDKILKESKKW